jgi:hypothetical protein
MNIYAIHDGDEMLHGGCLGYGYLIVVVYQVKSGHRRHCDGQAKGVPPRRHGRGPRPMGPLRSVRDAHVSETRLSDRVDHWTASLAISFDCDHTRPDPAPWPATTTTLYPSTTASVLCRCCFLLFLVGCCCTTTTNTTTSFSLLFCSRPSAISLLRQLELRGASFASTRDVTFGFFFQSACLVLPTLLLPDLTIASRRAIHLDIAILI